MTRKNLARQVSQSRTTGAPGPDKLSYSVALRVMAVSRPASTAVLDRAEPGIAAGPAMASLADRTNASGRIGIATLRRWRSKEVTTLKKIEFDLMTDSPFAGCSS